MWLKRQYNYNTTAMQEFFSCIAVVLHLCGPLKARKDVEGDDEKQANRLWMPLYVGCNCIFAISWT